MKVKTWTICGSAVIALGLSACASSNYGGSATNHRNGQESSLHTGMGETGIPHGNEANGIPIPDTSATTRMGAPSSSAVPSVNPAAGVGQESSAHTSQGETGTPHQH